jgi:hypothetical protein
MMCCATLDRFPRAAGRLVFGAIMVAGTLVLLQRMFTYRESGAARVIVTTWLVAAAGGWVAHELAHVCRPRRVERIFVLSYALPTLGIACLLPLSIQLPVVHALGLDDGLDTWALILWANTAQIAFAWLSTLRAVQLARGDVAITTHRIGVVVMLAASIPGALLIFPPLVAFVLGLFIVPLLRRMERIITRERDLGDLPMAIVV